jgi:glycosyltransferase involved in cell wall biosynthesis
MTITHVVRMWPDEGDPQLGSFVRSHIAALRDAGLQQRVVVWSGQRERPLPLDGVEVVAGPFVAPGPKGWNAKVGSVLNLGRPDVLHVHGSGGDTAYLFVRSIMQWGQRLPRITSEHQHFGDGPLPSGTLWSHRFANVRTAVSPFLAARFASVGHVDVVPNCWAAPLPHQLRKVHDGGRRVLHIGDWVDATKGISPLLEAWRIHSERNPLDHLTLVGDGVDRPLLEPLTKATPNCTWLGRMVPEDLESEMGRHDVLVVNSPRETFSMVVGQARERGLHVLSTRCGGPESVYPNMSGITYRDGSSHDLADLAAALHALPLASEQISVEELAMFRQEAVAAQFIQLYRNVGIKI